LTKSEFENWLTENGRSDKTARHYSIALHGKLSNLANEHGLLSGNILSITEKDELTPLIEALKDLDAFEEFNKRGNQMYSAALNRYADFLESVDLSFCSEIEAIQNTKNLDATTKKAVIESRVGQGKFRTELKKYWRACSVTAFPNLDLLIASHIKPWRVSTDFERLHKYNGLLLQPNLDALFDKGYISFSERGVVLISRTFKNSAIKLGAKPEMTLSRVEEHHQPYITYHREHVFLD